MEISDVLKLNYKMKKLDDIDFDYLRQIKPIADEMVYDYAMDFLRKKYPIMADKYLKIMAEDFIQRFDKKVLYQSAFISQKVKVEEEKWWTNGGYKSLPVSELEKSKQVLNEAICNPKIYVRKKLSQDGVPIKGDADVQSKSDKEKRNRETERRAFDNDKSTDEHRQVTFSGAHARQRNWTEWRQPVPQTDSSTSSLENRKRVHKYCSTCVLPKECKPTNKSTIQLISNKQDVIDGAPENKKRRTIYDPSLDSPKIIPGTPQKKLLMKSMGKPRTSKSKKEEPCKRYQRALEPANQSPKHSPMASTSSSFLSSTSSNKYGKMPHVFQRLYNGQATKQNSRCSLNKSFLTTTPKTDRSFNKSKNSNFDSPSNSTMNPSLEDQTLKPNYKFSDNSFLFDDEILDYSFDENLLVSNISSDTMRRFGAAEHHVEELKEDIEEIQLSLRRLAVKMENKL